MTRPHADEYFLRMARLVASRGTCLRRKVGCVLVGAHKHVLATGYNGVPKAFPHCTEGHPCPGAAALSGTRVDECFATHAEQNALLQCADVFRILTCYTTVAPCVTCSKLLLNTSCERIVCAEMYTETTGVDLWRRGNRQFYVLRISGL